MYCAGCAGKVVTDYPVFRLSRIWKRSNARLRYWKPFCDSKTGRKIQPGQLQDRSTAHHSLCSLQRKAELGGVCFEKEETDEEAEEDPADQLALFQ